MSNKQCLDPVCYCVFALFLIADKQRTAVKRTGIERGIFEYTLGMSLTLKWKSKNVFIKWNSKRHCFREEVMLLFWQEIKGWGFVSG